MKVQKELELPGDRALAWELGAPCSAQGPTFLLKHTCQRTKSTGKGTLERWASFDPEDLTSVDNLPCAGWYLLGWMRQREGEVTQRESLVLLFSSDTEGLWLFWSSPSHTFLETQGLKCTLKPLEERLPWCLGSWPYFNKGLVIRRLSVISFSSLFFF